MPDLASIFAHNQFNTSLGSTESFSAILSMKPPIEIVKILIKDTSPPLWNLSQWVAFQLFGASEPVIRGLAFIFFLVAVVFAFLLTHRLWGRVSAVWAATLTFFNPLFFSYAFEGHVYSLLAAGVAGSMYFFLQGNLIGYVAMTTWALYSHQFAIFALVIQGLWCVYKFIRGKRATAKRMIKGFLICGLLYSLWMYPLYLQTSKLGGSSLPILEVKDLLILVRNYLAEGIKTPSIVVPYFDFPLSSIALAAATVVAVLRKWHKRVESSLFVFLWFVGPIFLTWFVTKYYKPIYFYQYLLYCVPAAMILLATNRRKVSNIMLGILIVLYIFTDFNYFVNPTKMSIHETKVYLDGIGQEGDLFINWYQDSNHLWESKYYGFDAPLYVLDDQELSYYKGVELMDLNKDIISEIPADTNKIGVFTSNPEVVEIEGFVGGQIIENGNLKLIWLERVGEADFEINSN